MRVMQVPDEVVSWGMTAEVGNTFVDSTGQKWSLGKTAQINSSITTTMISKVND